MTPRNRRPRSAVRGIVVTLVAAALTTCAARDSAFDEVQAARLRDAKGSYLAGQIAALDPFAVLDDRDSAWTVDWSGSGDFVAFAHLDARVFRLGLWRMLPDARKLADPGVNPNEFDVEAAAFSPDGGRIATASRDGHISFFLRDGGALAKRFKAEEPLVSVAWSPSNLWAAAGGGLGLLVAVAPDGLLVSARKTHGDEVRALAFAPNGSLWSASWDKSAVVSDLANVAGPLGEGAAGALVLKEKRRLAFEQHVNDLTVSADGKVLGLALGETRAERTPAIYRREKMGTVEPVNEQNAGALVHVQSGAVIARFAAHHGIVSTASISPDGMSLATGGWDRRVYVFGFGERDNPVARIELGWIVRRVRFSPDGRFLAVAAWTPQVAHGGRSSPSVAIYKVLYRRGVEVRAR